jgi:23S rRNA (pseudouridine1915-N3)-methyltransferase
LREGSSVSCACCCWPPARNCPPGCFEEYANRLTGEFKLELKEIALGQRGSGDVKQAIAKEGEKMLAAMPSSAYVVALQVTGRAMTSEQLASFLQARANDGRDVVFCIGGPEGLSPAVDARADFKWSLSTLTLPHALARVMVAEALYRAVSIIKKHPYHRA